MLSSGRENRANATSIAMVAAATPTAATPVAATPAALTQRISGMMAALFPLVVVVVVVVVVLLLLRLAGATERLQGCCLPQPWPKMK
jgi:small neutral amino acid transporter SnatA (MarC family)